MIKISSIKISSIKISNNIFQIINLLCFGLTIAGSESIGTITSLVIIGILLLNIDIFNLLKKDIWFALFVLINILSIVAYIYNGRGVMLFFQGISYNLIPTLLYLLGAKRAVMGHADVEISSNIISASFLLMAIGLFFYTLFPDIFFAHIGQDLSTYRWGIHDYRYGSYISSANLGSLCVACIPLLFLLRKSKMQNANIVVCLTIVCSLFLCMQRSAWVVAVLIAMVIMMSSSIKTNTKIAILFGMVVVVVVFVFFGNMIFSDAQLQYFETRIGQINLQKMIIERINQWEAGVNVFVENPLGYGLGAMGHKAADAGYVDVVADGNYLRILCEVGIVGFLLFIGLVVRAVQRSGKRHFELCLLIMGYCLQAIGSNVFDLYFSSYVFWYVLGYLNHAKQTKQQFCKMSV